MSVALFLISFLGPEQPFDHEMLAVLFSKWFSSVHGLRSKEELATASINLPTSTQQGFPGPYQLTKAAQRGPAQTKKKCYNIVRRK